MIALKTRRLIELRIRRGLSQRSLARRLGISSGYMSQLETGQRNPSPRMAKNICELLNVEFDELFDITDDRASTLDPTGTEGDGQ